jgi:ethanolamine permease
MNKPELKKELNVFLLWGLGVGYVISGMYFGWNLGLPHSGTYGFVLATTFIALMYICFTLTYAELTCMMPNAGGAFTYALKAFGPKVGFVCGMAQIIEFVFAPPAIAFALGAYLHIFLPMVSVLNLAVLSYLIFTTVIYSALKRQSFWFSRSVAIFFDAS